MHNETHVTQEHAHHFGQDRRKAGESRTVVVAVLTASMMGIEIAAGVLFGSMALLADGLHMGSHAVALGIAVFAYVYARRHAYDTRFLFGTGKVNALGGFTGAILLALFAAVMAWESLERFWFPVPIAFNQAIAVAVLGLVVNGVSVLILGRDEPEHAHDHGGHEHPHPHHHRHHGKAEAGHRDHNLRSAYLHVLADTLTSVFAIVSLLAGKYFGWIWMDPLMGIVGAVMVAIWSRGLLQVTGRVLLDMRVSEELEAAVRGDLENEPGVRVTDLHIWSIGPGIHAAAISLVAPDPASAHYYRGLLPGNLGLVHVTIEVQRDTRDSE
jgi:cation diffusion facilitator family transporter